MWKWIPAKSHQREIFSYVDTSSDRLRGIFLYGIFHLRANIIGLCWAKDAKRLPNWNIDAVTRTKGYTIQGNDFPTIGFYFIIIYAIHICNIKLHHDMSYNVRRSICDVNHRPFDTDTWPFRKCQMFYVSRCSLFERTHFSLSSRDDKGVRTMYTHGYQEESERLWSWRSIPVTSPTIISRHSRRIILADGASWWLSGGPSRAEVRTVVTGRYWRAIVTDRLVCVRVSACAHTYMRVGGAVTGRYKFSSVTVRYEYRVRTNSCRHWVVYWRHELYNA